MTVVTGGEHEDRQRLRFGAQQAADLQAIKARQHQVEDHQVRFAAASLGQHVITTGNHRDAELIALQVAGDQFGQGAVVFDQKDIRHG
ncbi:hypothetical protein D3C79_740470 [compost metagenome]